MKLLITGGSGFIGRNLYHDLKESYEIKAPGHEQLDLMNPEEVRHYLKENLFDVVIHCAGQNGINRLSSDYELLNENLLMYYSLTENRQFFGKLIYFGSGAQYSMDHYLPLMKEEYFGSHIPKDPYSFSKYIMARSCPDDGNIYDLVLFGVFGPYELWKKRFISNAICRVLSGAPITITRNVFFDYLWVHDLSRIVEWFIQHDCKYRHYNVCRGKSRDLYTIAETVKEVMGAGNTQIIVKEEGLKKEYSGDNTRLCREVPEIQFTGFKESVRQLVQFYQSAGGNTDGHACFSDYQ